MNLYFYKLTSRTNPNIKIIDHSTYWLKTENFNFGYYFKVLYGYKFEWSILNNPKYDNTVQFK